MLTAADSQGEVPAPVDVGFQSADFVTRICGRSSGAGQFSFNIRCRFSASKPKLAPNWCGMMLGE